MAKAEQKTLPTKVTVDEFFNTIEDETKREDCKKLSGMMAKLSKEKPVMWGPAIVGFGCYHYKYASGHEGDACLMGFSPRKSSISLYVATTIKENEDAMKKLGKYKLSGSCLHIKKLDDVDEKALKDIISNTYKTRKAKLT